jgi:formyl-CoA transferase
MTGHETPLAGIRVADFTRVLAGPLATMTLADLGADVVKVERPGAGDDTRQWGPPWSAHGSSYFACVNRSKQSIALDLRDEQDLAVARALAAEADVVVENFRSGNMERLGLGYDEVARGNPGVVFCSITGFGSGKGASLPGYDFVVQAVGGLMSITGDPAGEPGKVGVALVDVLTGKDAVIGILAALHERARSGQGPRIEVDLLSSLLGSLANQASAFMTTGEPPGRMANRHPSIAPYETLRCADGPIAVACGNDGQFARLCGVTDLEHLVDDPRFATNPSRVAHRDDLVAELEAALRTRPVADWVACLTGVGVAAGPVNDLGAALDLAESLGLAPTVPVGDGHPAQVRHPITWSRSRLRRPAPPPALGEHTSAVRARLQEQP